MTQEKMLEKGNFVVYKDYKNEKIIVEDLRTGEIHTIDYFDEDPPKLGNRYVVFKGGYIYDLQKKELITKPKQVFAKYNACYCEVSDDFLNGEIPFYYAYVYIPAKHQKGFPCFCYCTIFNRDKIIGHVKRNAYTVLMPTTLMLTIPEEYEYRALYETYNYLITKETQYISDVDNEEGLIRFYKLTENSLELVNELPLNKQCFYETHFASRGNKFVICEDENEDKKRIFLYNVDTGRIEYKNDIYFLLPDPPYDENDDIKAYNINVFIFLTNLLLYAHGFQDSYFHALRNFRNEIVLVPIEKWNTYKKLAKELAKSFFHISKEPRTSPSLRI